MSAEEPPLKKLKKDQVRHCLCCPKFQEWREKSTAKFNLPKGRYYIGDLALVLPRDLWEEVPDKPGKFTLSDGRVVVCFEFKGCQPERDNDFDFYIESEMIGITLYAGLCKQWGLHAPMFGGLGPHFNQLKEICKTKKITMVDFMKIAGTKAVYDTDFDCQQHTMSHYKRDDHSVSTHFGDKVSAWTIHGSYDSGDESEVDGYDSEEEAQEVDEE